MTSYKKKLQPASQKNLEMYLGGPPCSLSVEANMAEAVGMVNVVDTAEAEDAGNIVDMVGAVEWETATKVSEPIA
jgi:hypothetical protein